MAFFHSYNDSSSITMSQRQFELIAVSITGLSKFLFIDALNWRFAYITTACLFWLGYVMIQARREPDSLDRWGFRREHFWETSRFLLPFAVLSILACLGFAYRQGTEIFNWHILPTLILYPIWGLVQQFLIISLGAGNLQALRRPQLSMPVIIGLTATLFGIIHYPHWPLIGATTILALVYAYVFLKWRNLWPLGLFHGWLGSCFLFYVMGRDAWAEVFL